MSRQRFDSIVKLQKLIPELRLAMEEGKFIVGLDRAIADLPPAEQEKLLPALRAGSLDYKAYKKLWDEYQATKKAAALGVVPGRRPCPA